MARKRSDEITTIADLDTRIRSAICTYIQNYEDLSFWGYVHMKNANEPDECPLVYLELPILQESLNDVSIPSLCTLEMSALILTYMQFEHTPRTKSLSNPLHGLPYKMWPFPTYLNNDMPRQPIDINKLLLQPQRPPNLIPQPLHIPFYLPYPRLV